MHDNRNVGTTCTCLGGRVTRRKMKIVLHILKECTARDEPVATRKVCDEEGFLIKSCPDSVINPGQLVNKYTIILIILLFGVFSLKNEKDSHTFSKQCLCFTMLL